MGRGDIGSPASAFEKGRVGKEGEANFVLEGDEGKGSLPVVAVWNSSWREKGGGHKMEEELLVCSGKRKNI